MNNNNHDYFVESLSEESFDYLYDEQKKNADELTKASVLLVKYEKMLKMYYPIEKLYDDLRKKISRLVRLADAYADAIKMKTFPVPTEIKYVYANDVTTETPLEIFFEGDESEEEEQEFDRDTFCDPLESYDAPVQLSRSEIRQMFKSELHRVPFMPTCELLGGNKKKKQPNKRVKRVPRKKLQLNGIPRNLTGNDIMPPYKIVTLKYYDPLMQVAAPTQSFVVKTLRINALFDPDPAVLTSGVAGFNELMLFYEFFKVMKTTVSWEPANNETFQVMVGYIFSNVNLNTLILTRQDAIDALENGITTRAVTLQNRNGGPSAQKITRTIHPKFLLGDPQLYNGDVNYTGTSVSDPPDQLFVNLIVVSPTNLTLLLNGTVGKLEMRFQARLFGRRYLNDALRNRRKLDDYSIEELSEAIKVASIKGMEVHENRR